MKIILRTYQNVCFALILSIMSTVCFSQYSQDRYHVKDTLSKYQVASYSIYKMKNNGADSLLLETLSFDKNGNLIKEFNPKYNITISYKYDSLQQLIERHTYCPGIQNETEYAYYSENKLSKEIRKDSSGFINQTREYFYENSRLHREYVKASFKSYGTSRSYEINYQYDSTGYKVAEYNDDYSRRTEIERNKYGGIIYFEMIDSLNLMPDPVWFSYNKNLRIEEYHYFNNQKIITEKMIYDKQGKIIEKHSCGDEWSNHPCSISYKFYYTYYSK